jgi:phospholipid N-methyltransferase
LDSMCVTGKEREGHPSPPKRLASAGPRAAPLQLLLFAVNFLKHPKAVGWVFPSSRFLVNQVLKQIDWTQARVIVEYGPGVGAFTHRVLKQMRPDAKLIALEINSEFFRFLSSALADPRLHLAQNSAADIDKVLHGLGFSHADYVISGIPFKPMPPVLRETIIRKTHSVLRPKGRLLVYQFSNAVLPCLERVFARVSRDFELLNILPARLFFCAR